jgi:hypothetical protein
MAPFADRDTGEGHLRIPDAEAMKALVPCCERAKPDAFFGGYDDEVYLLGNDGDDAIYGVHFCPWCGKRFEVTEVQSPD